MTSPININPDIVRREQALQMQYLRDRVLALAQMLHDMTIERDQAIGDRDAQAAELTSLKEEMAKGAADGASE